MVSTQNIQYNGLGLGPPYLAMPCYPRPERMKLIIEAISCDVVNSEYERTLRLKCEVD